MGLNDYKSYCFRGATYYYLKNEGSALTDLNKSIELNPNYETSYYYRANLKYSMADDKGCIEDCDKAIAIKKYYDTYYTRAIAKLQSKLYDAAIADFNEALALNSSHGKSLIERGIAYYFLEKDDLARKDLDAGLLINKEYSRGYYFRGKLKKFANDKVGCCEDLKKAKQYGHTKADEELIKNGCN
jgi:tetratricopeptide (TPR) repeat protein